MGSMDAGPANQTPVPGTIDQLDQDHERNCPPKADPGTIATSMFMLLAGALEGPGNHPFPVHPTSTHILPNRPQG